MSDHSRALPSRPNLRFLKLEAKRRLASGEFPTLTLAQLAIAREHGHSSWAVLKAVVETSGNPALDQIRWVAARFAEAPSWQQPDEAEWQEHFGDRFLSAVPADALVTMLRTLAPKLTEEFHIAGTTPRTLRARVGDLWLDAAVEVEPPYRLTGLRAYPVGAQVTDPRVADLSTAVDGAIPEGVVPVVEKAMVELGLAGIVAAGADQSGRWAAVRGWADIDGATPMRADDRFPVYGVTKVVTSTALLCLVATGQVDLDLAANDYLRSLRLADAGITVRELLTHTSGVSSPGQQFAAVVPDQVALLGDVVPCDGERGVCAPANGGYAVLGLLISDVTGKSYEDAVSSLVFGPLGMAGSSFPSNWAEEDAVTGHDVTGDGVFEPVRPEVCTMPAAGGMWSTATDLVRFGKGWAGLLPPELAAEAVRPQAVLPNPGADVGYGWLISSGGQVYGHPAMGPGAAASLLIRPAVGAVAATCVNRMVAVEPANARLVPLMK